LQHQPGVEHTVSLSQLSESASDLSVAILIALAKGAIWTERMDQINQESGFFIILSAGPNSAPDKFNQARGFAAWPAKPQVADEFSLDLKSRSNQQVLALFICKSPAKDILSFK
jgi:hypothetical protein